MGAHDHKAAVANLGNLTAAVLTISDTRTQDTDESGKLLQELLVAAGHRIGAYRIIPDDPKLIQEAVGELATKVDFIVATGGTGVSPRDQTIEACRPLFTKELEGFGDMFRYLSYQEIGSAAILSRSTAGSVGQAMVFCLPGSRGAVRLGVEELILPEIRHLVAHIRKA